MASSDALMRKAPIIQRASLAHNAPIGQVATDSPTNGSSNLRGLECGCSRLFARAFMYRTVMCLRCLQLWLSVVRPAFRLQRFLGLGRVSDHAPGVDRRNR